MVLRFPSALLALSLGAVTLLAPVPSAHASRGIVSLAYCARDVMPGAIQVRVESVRPVMRTDVSMRDLAQLRSDSVSWGASTHRTPPHRERFIIGFAYAEMGAVTRVSVATGYPLGGHPPCLRPTVEVTLHYRTLEVHVAREIAHLACSRAQVLAHEMEHVQAYNRQLAAAGSRLEQELRAHFTRTGYAGDAATLQRQLHALALSRWEPLARIFLREAAEREPDLDTPAEYARLSNSCNGEIGRTL